MSKAESGEAVAQFKIGIYEKGSDEVPQNLLEAQWYRMAAEQNPATQYNLGMMYQSGHGVSEDANEANRWFERYNQNKKNTNFIVCRLYQSPRLLADLSH